MKRHDLSRARIPEHALAVLEALRFDGDSRRLQALDDDGFRRVLEFCDRSQLTLLLNALCSNALPRWVQERIDRNLQNYSQRFERLRRSAFEILGCLRAQGIDCVLLKGFSHSPDFMPDPMLRVQGDIDLWTTQDSVPAAHQALADLGYVSVGAPERRHLAPMVRETRWQWRGDYFAPALPIPVELHYKLWDDAAEFIPGPNESEFWDRRSVTSVDGQTVQVLSKADALAFAALHLLMHLLHGDVRLARAWEIAHFLHTHGSDDGLWSEWCAIHPDSLRQLEVIIFQLVSDWFGVTLPAVIERDVESLPKNVRLWMEQYALSPIEALFHPTKDEVWLHILLTKRFRDKCSVFCRRVAPMRVPARVDESTLNGERPTVRQMKSYVVHITGRALRHLRALAPVVAGAARWHWIRAWHP